MLIFCNTQHSITQNKTHFNCLVCLQVVANVVHQASDVISCLYVCQPCFVSFMFSFSESLKLKVLSLRLKLSKRIVLHIYNFCSDIFIENIFKTFFSKHVSIGLSRNIEANEKSKDAYMKDMYILFFFK